ncbi:putative transporter C4B3.13 [Psilocybe cubensis]|uniref:Transporter C4B3.13 n=1 Tax=Psilocybe cubensis TaxID=181762 RepID=A0ACB8GQD5_PSICU|nr:putative transporter C4B3.13 [Psilocybe cubensis]KAH9477940.1 putative transporter C4B3.13 [Psilocybe cubensis]
MSSTYAHYQGPSSLPTDYAIVSSLNNRHRIHDDDDQNDNGDELSRTVVPDSVLTPSPTQRRPSFRASGPYYSQNTRPRNPTIGSYPRDDSESSSSALPDESTPLLLGGANPPIPRVEESIDRNPLADDESAMKMFWEELWILLKYATPVFGTHVLEYSLVIVSVVSIGHISTTALAAISLGSMTASVSGFSILQGFASALDTLLPAAWTSDSPQLVGLWAQRMTVVMFSTLIPMFLIWFNAESILLLLKQDPEVASLAAVYLRWISLGLPGLFTVPTRIVLIAAPVNALLNWLLVWGPPPFRLGFIGAPIASALSFNLISLLSLLYAILYTPLSPTITTRNGETISVKTAWHPLSARMFSGLGVLWSLGLSGVGQTASEWWAWELVALAASLLGPVALATQSVLLVSSSTTFQAPFAVSVATAVRIGNLLGECKAKRAGVAAKTAMVMALLIGVFMRYTSQARLSPTPTEVNANITTLTTEVVQLTADIIPLLSLFQVFDGTSAIGSGVLRARGKQFLGALLNLSAYYVFGIPLGIYLTFWHDMGLHGLWIGLTFSLVYCALCETYIVLRTDWDREVGRAQRRVKDGEAGKKGMEAREGGEGVDRV